MTDGYPALDAAISELNRADVAFALVHESALAGWGIDNNAFLSAVDALILTAEGFDCLHVAEPAAPGEFVTIACGDCRVRLWSRKSLNLVGPFDVVACGQYACEALAPELVLQKLAYSPDAENLMEQRARLAAIVYSEALSDEEIEMYSRYVRGV